jgi:Holliday junction resolvase RusA-like endonuclease
VIEFEVHGVPAPQGSKNPWGGEANKRTRPWRGQVSQVAAAIMQGRDVLLGPVRVNVIFAFPRPKSHFRTGKNAHLLRETAPHWHTSVPDADKLQRAIGDALQGVVIRDDKQISGWIVDKIYDNRAYARVIIEELT